MYCSGNNLEYEWKCATRQMLKYNADHKQPIYGAYILLQ